MPIFLSYAHKLYPATMHGFHSKSGYCDHYCHGTTTLSSSNTSPNYNPLILKRRTSYLSLKYLTISPFMVNRIVYTSQPWISGLQQYSWSLITENSETASSNSASATQRLEKYQPLFTHSWAKHQLSFIFKKLPFRADICAPQMPWPASYGALKHPLHSSLLIIPWTI